MPLGKFMLTKSQLCKYTHFVFASLQKFLVFLNSPKTFLETCRPELSVAQKSESKLHQNIPIKTLNINFIVLYLKTAVNSSMDKDNPHFFTDEKCVFTKLKNTKPYQENFTKKYWLKWYFFPTVIKSRSVKR